MTTLRARRLFDGAAFAEDVSVSFSNGVIEAVGAGDGEALPDDWLLVPGFVDLQVNGGGGVLFNDATTLDGVAAIAAAHARAGTTALLPTLISDRESFAAALEAVDAAMARGVAGVIGVHLEGPFINPVRRGIHPAARLCAPDEDNLALLCQPRRGVRLLTLAPEMVAPGIPARLGRAGVRVFAGHSDARYEQAMAALDDGIAGFTHLFNAMSPFGSRAPGCVGAAFAHGTACAGIIVDGLHVHPASVRAAWRLLGSDRMFLVSDAMPTTASDATAFRWDGETITLHDGRLARADGTLAGAHLTMAEAVANAVRLCGIPLGDALRMATSTPARCTGVAQLGRIEAGARADFVALDAAHRVVGAWQAGRLVR